MDGLGESFFNEGIAAGRAEARVVGMIIGYYDCGKTVEDISIRVSKSPQEVKEILAAEGRIPETV